MAKQTKLFSKKISESKMIKSFREEMDAYLSNTLHTTFEDASVADLYKAVSTTVNTHMWKKRVAFNEKRWEIEKKDAGRKKICYICMEFLMGQSLKNNLYNLGETEVVSDILKARDMDIDL